MRKIKTIDFKSIEPFFSQERDGIKPFTTRRIEKDDKRFRALCRWKPTYKWGIRITNPATGESFIRQIVIVDFLRYIDWREADFWKRHARFLDWRMIVMGETI